MKIKTALRAAACVSLAAALACGCSAPQSAADFARKLGLSQGAQISPEVPYDTSKLDDGKLRILYSYNSSLGSSILCGSKVLCEAEPSDTLSLITDDVTGEAHYYLHAWNDSSAESGRRCVIYNELGAEVLSFENEVRVWLTGNYLKVFSDTSVMGDYDLSEPNSIRLFDLSTQEDGSIKGELAVPENTVECTPMQGYIAYTIYSMPEGVSDIYDDNERYAHCSVQIHDENGNIYEDTGCDATTIYMYNSRTLPGWINIRYYKGSDFGAYRSALYRPADGKLLDNFIQTCGGTTACFKNADGKYELRDLSGAATTVIAEFEDQWVSDYIPGWVIRNGSDYTYMLENLTTGEQTAVNSYCYTDDILAVFTADSTLLGFDRESGELVLNTPVQFQTEAENGYSLYSLTGEYIWLQKFGGATTQSEIQIFDRGGLVADVTPLTERYDYIGDLTSTENGLLLVCSRSGPGRSSLYDVVDCNGNVLQSGLGLCYADSGSSLPDGCFTARRGYNYGWMDENGSWLYCRSIFSSLAADDGSYPY